MQLLDYGGTVIEWNADDDGPHSSLVLVYGPGHRDDSPMFVLRPDAALALGSAMVEWAKDRMRNGGLF